MSSPPVRSKLASHLLFSCFLLAVGGTACSSNEGASNGTAGILIAGTHNGFAMTTGSLLGCVVIGTNIGKGESNSIALTSAHCWPNVAICDDKKVRWADGSSSACVNVLGGPGRGFGDVIAFEIEGKPATLNELPIATSIVADTPIEIHDGSGNVRASCKVKRAEPGQSSFTHDCAGNTSGLSGAPVFVRGARGLELAGIHVSQLPNEKQATVWPVNFLQSLPSAQPGSLSFPRSTDHIHEVCRADLARYLIEKEGVSLKADDPGFAAAAGPKLHAGAYARFEAASPPYLTMFYEADCKRLAAGTPEGLALLAKGDADCRYGEGDENCARSCCKGVGGGFGAIAGWEDFCSGWKANVIDEHGGGNARYNVCTSPPVLGR